MKTESTAPSLLLLDASPRGERSHSRKLGQEFLTAWQAAHPGAQAVVRDLGHEPPPFVTEAWVEGAYAPPEKQSVAARAAINVSNRLVDEFLAAEEIVIATPIYNLTVPAVLKAWIDQIVRAGRTFTIGAGGYEGLAKGKRVKVLAASGSDFRLTGPGAGYNFLEPYLRAILGFIGITDVTFVYAHSLASDDAKRDQSLAEAADATRALATAA